MKIAVIGGGINGLFSSWELSKDSHEVDLYEEHKVLSKTSSSSSKLLHGGIRYLEQGHIGLVREALIDRYCWLTHAPQFCKRINMVIPVYKESTRSPFILYCGAKLYGYLSGKYNLGKTKWLSKNQLLDLCPDINTHNLKSGISFYDAQMDEAGLGNWVKEKATEAGVKIYEDTKIERFNDQGEIFLNSSKKYDLIINASGPWAELLNKKNKIESSFSLKLIKGSHLIIDKNVSNYFLFQEVAGSRIIFIMPYKNKTLIGTTEIEHSLDDEIKCSKNEIEYLTGIYNQYFKEELKHENILSTFSGVRPIINNKKNKGFNPSSASRESVIERFNKCITIYGGKWTSAPSLSKKLSNIIDKKYT